MAGLGLLGGGSRRGGGGSLGKRGLGKRSTGLTRATERPAGTNSEKSRRTGDPGEYPNVTASNSTSRPPAPGGGAGSGRASGESATCGRRRGGGLSGHAADMTADIAADRQRAQRALACARSRSRPNSASMSVRLCRVSRYTVPRKLSGRLSWKSRPLIMTTSPTDIVPACTPCAAITMAADRLAEKMAFCPKLSAPRLVATRRLLACTAARCASNLPASWASALKYFTVSKLSRLSVAAAPPAASAALTAARKRDLHCVMPSVKAVYTPTVAVASTPKAGP